MKFLTTPKSLTTMRIPITLLAAIALATHAAAVPANIVRPEIRNVHGTTVLNGGVNFFNGTIANGTNTTPPASDNNVLRESSFGMPFGSYLSPYESFGKDVLFNGRLLANGTTVPGVYTKLYPDGYKTEEGVPETQNSDDIKHSKRVFRYKWLMYGEDPSSTDPNPPILNIFEQSTDSSQWFTETDRTNARIQIAVLREALAIDPLNRDLQSALLDIYYDWSVAEMQFARSKLVSLATVRLGLLTAPKFIIDEEIESYKELVAITRIVLDLYGELFSFEMEGVDPRDLFASSIADGRPEPTGGAPFGYFIFQNQLPLRNQTPTQYADGDGLQNVIDPGDSNTFSGFKDYRTLLTVLGQHIQYQADLADLRGRRQATTPDGADITVARQGLTEAQMQATSAGLLEHMFRDIDFHDVAFDNTGVRAAKTLARTALNDALGVRSFLNGTANALRLDPNFLLLVPPEPGSGLFDSYDIRKGKLTAVQGTLAVGPLAVALEKLGDPTNALTGGGAIQAYTVFRASVAQVEAQLNTLEDEFKERFVNITGYSYDTEGDLWNGINPKPGVGSELTTAQRSIDSYIRRNIVLGENTLRLLEDAKLAQEAVTLAIGIRSTITGAQSIYDEKASSAWDEIHGWAGSAAAAQSVADGAFAAAGLDSISKLTGQAVVIAIATGINTGIQTAAATRTSVREQEIDQAAIAFDTTLALAEQPLTVKQAELEVGALMREAYANRLEIEDNFTGLAQAQADRESLLREVQRAQDNLRADRATLAGQYYADPIHFIRSETAILQADAAFRNAQRWVFFTARALEYKWSERFSIADTSIGESYDIGTIIKARNAKELETIVQKMHQWDNARTGTPASNITVISMRDQFVTPNPDDINLDFSDLLVDSGVRYDPETRTVIDKQERFHRILESYKDPSGNIVIPFDTTVLENFASNFFNGADFSDSSNPDSGFYRNKIDWIAVNIIASDGITPPNINGKSGRITYAGNTFFRTRVPVRPDRSVAATVVASEAFDAEKDFGSEFIITPLRFFQDTSFTGVFDLFEVQNVTAMKFAYSADSANNDTVLDRLTDNTFGFLRSDLKERSVAATRWQLRINSNQVNVANITDIELVVRQIAYPRPQLAPN